ncbi:MAG: peptidylprolyl isomerase [Bacteroidaceae bacterium]|jgi:peptidyl-prolyl cis-trans isomerase SurA|nr:peptidylprolyl isomerase [Bacteroidaceae bacterium]MBQ2073853.1 peptidylprolyl isomerase [Bacteroidaceae bacterium]MBR6845353.1 peptidylprolyl isomerase [Bacteroidaceae bacterium]
MKKLLILALVTICAQHLYAQNHTVDEVIWVVGDEAILRSDVERMRTIYGNEIKGNPYCVIPEQLAIQKLFLHQAAIDSVSVSDGDVAPYVEQDINEKVMMAGSKEKLEEYMRMPMSQIREELFEQYKNEMTARQMKQKITAGIKITPAEVRRYFRDLPQDSLPFIPTQVEVQILTRHPRIRREEIERVKEQLRGWAERIQAGTTSFSALARMFSKDEGSARMGGELEYYGRTQLDPAFANVAFSLTDPKKVSKVVQSEYGYHIIQLIDKRGDKIKVRHILRRPEVDPKDIEACMSRLDSIATDIKENKFTFEVGAQELSDDKDSRNNNGIMTNLNKETGVATTRFEMGDLPSEIARMVDKMEIGEISQAFTMTDKHGMETCAIIKLKNRIPAHRASITEDFQILKGTVEAKKSEEMIQQWIKDKQKSTYVRINEDWRNCDFTYPGWAK